MTRAEQVLLLFEQDPIKAVGLSRTFLKTDPKWKRTSEFINLVCHTPFGDWLSAKAIGSTEEWDAMFNASTKYVE